MRSPVGSVRKIILVAQRRPAFVALDFRPIDISSGASMYMRLDVGGQSTRHSRRHVFSFGDQGATPVVRCRDEGPIHSDFHRFDVSYIALATS
jgi:hypothetical protein